MKDVIAWITENWEWVVLLVAGIIELVLRYVPTASNVSILDQILKFLRWLVPNKRKTDGRDEISFNGDIRLRKKWVPLNKHTL